MSGGPFRRCSPPPQKARAEKKKAAPSEGESGLVTDPPKGSRIGYDASRHRCGRKSKP